METLMTRRMLTSMTCVLMSVLLLAVFSVAPAARAQSFTGHAPAPADLRLVEEEWAVPEQAPAARIQSAPAYENPATVPSGVELPGKTASSDVFILGLAAFTGAFLGGMLAGSICCGVFLIYYY
ncbi:MAG: hypothetical protein ACI9VR_001008 [Cognaticolwellia sp.]|jgi:hypothetical protein